MKGLAGETRLSIGLSTFEYESTPSHTVVKLEHKISQNDVTTQKMKALKSKMLSAEFMAYTSLASQPLPFLVCGGAGWRDYA